MLVLDDDNLVVRAVARTLRSRGLIVDSTTDPGAALDLARSAPPDAVVSDLHMPRSCGAQFLATVASFAPDAMRVLMSADPDFRPEIGSLAEARVHSLVAKTELASLAGLLLAQLHGRTQTAETADERVALARQVARGLARPATHEDEEHRRSTSCWAALVAAMLDLPAAEVEQARIGAILHDVGQVTIPPRAFARTGSLTPGERALLDEHPGAGTRIVDAMPALRCALPVIASHHERQDGSGYPARLAGDAVPGAARAFQVVDAYDALRRGRPHAPARSHDAAIAELTRHSGRQHDPRAVGALAALGEAGLDAALRDAAPM